MSTFQEFIHKLNNLFNMVTDWLLIVFGIILVVKAAMAIDVSSAKFVIMGIGALLIAIGFWYRHRRKKRHR